MRHLLKALVLASALIALWATLLLLNAEHPITAQTQSNRISNSNSAPPPASVVDDFSPEFANLPTFDEIAAKRESAKLIEVAEFLPSENEWPSYGRTDLDIRNEDKWLGLYARNESLRFAETKLTRTPRQGYLGPGDEQHDWLKFDRKGHLMFLVAGVSGLQPGEVTTLFHKYKDEAGSLEQGFRRSFALGQKNYILRVSSGLQRDGGKVNVLVLESGGKSQIVTFNHYYKDHNTLYNSIGELIWAGDMDADGKLDLYFSDYGFEKGGYGSNLYLSSPATGADLIKRVAGFSSPGC